MKALLKVTAVTLNGDIVKIEDAHVVTETNGFYEVLVGDGTYKAVAAPKMGATVVTLTGEPTKAASEDIAAITKHLKVHADDLPKSEAKAYIANLGHSKLADAILTEDEFMSAMASQILNDDEAMELAVDAAMKEIPADSGETRESVREKIEEEASAQLAEHLAASKEDPFVSAFTAAFAK